MQVAIHQYFGPRQHSRIALRGEYEVNSQRLQLIVATFSGGFGDREMQNSVTACRLATPSPISGKRREK